MFYDFIVTDTRKHKWNKLYTCNKKIYLIIDNSTIYKNQYLDLIAVSLVFSTESGVAQQCTVCWRVRILEKKVAKGRGVNENTSADSHRVMSAIAHASVSGHERIVTAGLCVPRVNNAISSPR